MTQPTTQSTPSYLQVTRTLLREFRTYRKWLVALGAVGALVALAELAAVFLLAALASSLVGGEAAAEVGLKAVSPRQLALLAVLSVTVRGALDLVQIRLQLAAGRAYEVRSRQEVMDAYIGAEWAIQSEKEPGEVGNAFWAYLNTTKSAFRQVAAIPGQLVAFVVMLAGSFVAGGAWSLGIILGTGVLALVFRPFNGLAHRASEASRRATKRFAVVLYEVPITRLESRVFGVDRQFKDRVNGVIEEVADAGVAADRASGRLGSLYTTAVYLIAVLGLGALTVFAVAGPARYAAVILLLYRGLSYGRGLQSSYQTLVSSLPSIEELDRQRDMLLAGALREGGVPLADPIDRIELVDATFEYPNGRRALSHASLVLKRGEAVGIVGPSGAGKSTVAQLLLGVRDPTEGAVYVNGLDLRSVDLSTWFGRTALVPQNPVVLADSLENNVRCFRSGISDDEVRWALERSMLYDEMSDEIDERDVVAGDRRVHMSGGQAQRLTIARAIAGDPEFVIMDEPTSALDPITEEALRATLEFLRERTILVIIAHRLSTLKMCDRIIVMKDGCIEGTGDRVAMESDNEFFAEAVRLARLT